MTLLWEKLTNTGNSVLVHYTKVYYSLLQFVSSCREKEREYESWVSCERKNRHRPWIFFLHFLVVLKYLFTVCVITGSHLVCQASFQSSPQDEACKFLFPYIFVANVQCPVFTLSCFLDNSLQLNHPLPSTWCQQKEYPFPLVPDLRRKFGTSIFSKLFLITSALAWLFKDCLLFLIYLFIFNFNFLWVIQLCYTSVYDYDILLCVLYMSL